MRIELQHVEFMPKTLQPGVLYVSEKYQTAAHLCACGCGEKIRTPLGPSEWAVTEDIAGPSLWPSVGSWQRPCRSHYVIYNGGVRWAGQWSNEEVLAGRDYEIKQRQTYYDSRAPKGLWARFWTWLRKLFGAK
ncbi:MAG: hypothetical protein EON87_03855 [Brevundimonas sp.]|nr:MAG: hypothetical protein EON87_03855 [Brevundimonas sp.]